MHEKKLFTTEAKVGAVIIVAVLLLAWLSFQVGDFRFGRKGYLIEAVFKTVTGLEDKAKVRIAGVLVGSVERIYLRDGLARVVLRLDDDAVVREDSVVRIASVGILAEFYVDISAGSPDAPPLKPGAVVVGKEIMDITELVAQLAEVGGTIKTLAEQIGDTWGGKDSTVANLMENFNSLVDRLRVILDENRAGLNKAITQIGDLAEESRGVVADNREELRVTIANLREFSATLNKRAAEITEEISQTAGDLRGAVTDTRGELKEVLAAINSVAGKADRAAETLSSILRKVDEGEGTLGKLINEDETLAGFDKTVDEIGSIAEKINTGQGSLGRLVTDDKLITSMESSIASIKDYLTKGDKIRLFLGYRGEYLTRESDLKNYVTVKIQPQPDKFYLLELVDDPAGKRTTTETTTEIQQADGSYTVEERTTVDNLSKLKFSVQFAKSYGNLTLRGGLIESSGGVSLDYRALNDRALFTVEGWDFGRDEGPHLKFTARYRVYRDLYINAGADDWLEKEYRSAFLGAGLLFSDDDLKYFLSLVSFGK